MITGELKNKVDKIWEVFWTGGDSRKEGNVVTEQMLNAFLKSFPKYAGMLTASAAMSPIAGLNVMTVSLLGGFRRLGV